MSLINETSPNEPELTTRELAPSDQFDYWRSMLVEYYVPTAVSGPSSVQYGFNGTLGRRRFGGLIIDDVSADPVRVDRLSVRRSAEAEEYFQLAILRHGKTVVEQDGRQTQQRRPGDVVVFDASRPYAFEFSEPSSQVLVQVPHDLVTEFAPAFRKHVATVVPGDRPLARLAMASVLAMLQHGEDRCDSIAAQLAAASVTTFDGALTENAAGLGATVGEVWLNRAQEHIRTHLQDPAETTAKAVAQALNISERYLFVLFEEAGSTPHAWTTELRLQRAKRALQETANRQHIETIAGTVGFKSAPHFSRSFARRFGVTPSEMRAQSKARESGVSALHVVSSDPWSSPRGR